MSDNQQLIETFYTAFKNKDYTTMQQCYADQAVFNDAVFKNLDARQVRSMWEMLLKRSKDLDLTFTNVQSTGNTGSVEWIATYTFASTGRKVINKIKASFEFEHGKIIKHTDQFPFHTWAKQALGTTGLLLGRTGYLKKKVQKTAMKSLQDFMEKRP